MRITATEGYHKPNDCDTLTRCERIYCPKHRLLYNGCEDLLRGIEGDLDVPGGHRTVIEMTGTCPECRKVGLDIHGRI